MVQTRAQVRANTRHIAAILPSSEADPKGERPPSRQDDQQDITDPVAHWTNKGRWPAYYAMPTAEMTRKRLLRPKRPLLRRKPRFESRYTSQPTPNSQQSRAMKHAPYTNAKYTETLKTFGSYMHSSKSGPAPGSRLLCSHLLTCGQLVPEASHFGDATFERFCERVKHQNEALILRDVTPLLVPSAENLALHGLSQLDCLAESLDSTWDTSWPLTDKSPQPDYSVGFSREAFTAEQLEKLRPYTGDYSPGLQSRFMATCHIFFPFLTCEVKCGTSGLLPAERQNAHCMTLAVRGIVELFCLVGREKELHRRIVAFSIAHDHRLVLLHGHYAEIDGDETKFYQHTIKEFVFTNDDEKWMAYRFTRNIYLEWMPQHFRNLCSAIDLLPIESVSSEPSQGDSSDAVSSAAYPATGDSSEEEPSEQSRGKKRKRD